MELSVDDKWVIFMICYDLNNYFKNLLLEIREIQFYIAFINKIF
jgi:hypothetical protein